MDNMLKFYVVVTLASFISAFAGASIYNYVSGTSFTEDKCYTEEECEWLLVEECACDLESLELLR